MAGRVFVRGLEGEKYNLKAHRQERLDASHVVHADERRWRNEKTPGHEDSAPEARSKYLMAPGDDPFLTQSILAHFVEIDPASANGGHGHQNEAAFYILEGRGHEIHDTKRYDWEQGDLVVVHNDSRHQHFNDSPTERVLALVMKAKAQYLFLGLTQQGRDTTVPDGSEIGFGPRQDWSVLWSPGVDNLRKVVKGQAEPWQVTRDGRVKWLANREMDVRLFSIDVWLQEFDQGGHGAKRWQMGDQIYHVVRGGGYTLEWQVEADIDDRYYARVATEPRRHEWSQTDLIYVPQNCIVQHVATEPTLLLGAQNRLFKLLGYDNVAYLEDASAPRQAATTSA